MTIPQSLKHVQNKSLPKTTPLPDYFILWFMTSLISCCKSSLQFDSPYSFPPNVELVAKSYWSSPSNFLQLISSFFYFCWKLPSWSFLLSPSQTIAIVNSIVSPLLVYLPMEDKLSCGNLRWIFQKHHSNLITLLIKNHSGLSLPTELDSSFLSLALETPTYLLILFSISLHAHQSRLFDLLSAFLMLFLHFTSLTQNVLFCCTPYISIP